MTQLHSTLNDIEYWNFRLALLSIQEKVLNSEAYKLMALDLIDDLDAYLNKKENPWDLNPI